VLDKAVTGWWWLMLGDRQWHALWRFVGNGVWLGDVGLPENS